MFKHLAAWTLALSVSGCAFAPTAQHPLASFVEIDPNGKTVRTLSFALTQQPIETCISGDWKRAEPLNDRKRYTERSAYIREGDSLEVLLVNTVCDGYDSYVGKLTGDRFLGQHVQYGLGFSKTLGTVSGSVPVP